MAHFAELDENNVVIRVIVVSNDEIKDPLTGEEVEMLGIAFCKKTYGGNWIQTSYNGNIRKQYAGIGYTYNEELDAFIKPKPFDSWILNPDTAEWESPIGNHPEITNEQILSGLLYEWDEKLLQWNLKSLELPSES